MSSPESKSELLPAEELHLLGLYCTTDFPPQLEQDEGGFRLVPPPTPWFSLIGMTVVLGTLLGGFMVLLWQLSRKAPPEYWQWAIVILAVLVGTFGPLMLSLLRIRYLRCVSPLLEYERATGKVCLRAGQFVTERAHVFCLLAIGKFGYESAASELQLVSERNGLRSYHLILNHMDGNAHSAYGKLLRELCALTGFRGMVAQETGVCPGGKLVITEIVPADHPG